jgi:hypothetical protein
MTPMAAANTEVVCMLRNKARKRCEKEKGYGS